MTPQEIVRALRLYQYGVTVVNGRKLCKEAADLIENMMAEIDTLLATLDIVNAKMTKMHEKAVEILHQIEHMREK